MSYPDAVQKAIEGCKIRLPSWSGGKCLIYIAECGAGPTLAFMTGRARRFVPMVEEKQSTLWQSQCKGSNRWIG